MDAAERHLKVGRAGAKDARFNFTDVGSLTLGSDAETVAILRRKGVIVVDETLAARIKEGKSIMAHAPSEVGFSRLNRTKTKAPPSAEVRLLNGAHIVILTGCGGLPIFRFPSAWRGRWRVVDWPTN